MVAQVIVLLDLLLVSCSAHCIPYYFHEDTYAALNLSLIHI